MRTCAGTTAGELAYICDVRDDLLEQNRRQYPATTITADLGQVLADDTVDAVLVAVPADKHHAVTRCHEKSKETVEFVKRRFNRLLECIAFAHPPFQKPATGFRVVVRFEPDAPALKLSPDAIRIGK